MSKSVEGLKCPVCGGYMFDEDDIAFCPVCGAPHHRRCYLSNGHCAYEDDHGTERQFDIINAPKSKINDNDSEKSGAKSHKKTCRRCGKSTDENGDFCPFCGTPYNMTEPQHPTVISPFMGAVPSDPLGGVKNDEKIEDDITADEVKYYVGPGSQRYVPKFKNLKTGGKISWNWAAFLFPNAWYFYRKIYFPGGLFFILTAAASVMMWAINFLLDTLPDQSLQSYSAIYSYILDNYAVLDKMPIIVTAGGFAVSLIVRIISGLFGDFIYRKTAIDRIRAAKQEENFNENPRLALQQKGTVNPFLGMVGLFAVSWICYIMYALI